MFLFGASGHAKVITEIIQLNGGSVSGFYDDDPLKKSLMGIPVLGNTEAYKPGNEKSLISIGNNRIRKKVTEQIEAKYGQVIHPKAVVSETVEIEEGTVVMAGAVINPFTKIGRHVIINTAASVDHDCQVSDFVHIAPKSTLCGGISIGEGTLVGSGSVIIPNTKIGKWATIGAGSVVVKDVPDYAVVVGNPARIIKFNSQL
ncbi:acetyltransferase [Fulvivirga sediminis]|uniref:Acetyltransferase n=1 Tax=Fulvivirga sediminis TaxID=2803949 RepID=A0A937JZM7_9BACT|nr:acetyltransferase [Fulvivirga sediminis]MBL3655376.1 acetyltransferase [Fulvivirga sediminis]